MLLLPQQALTAFADATFPLGERVGEVYGHSGVGGEPLVVSHLIALVVRHAAAQLTVEAVSQPRKLDIEST